MATCRGTHAGRASFSNGYARACTLAAVLAALVCRVEGALVTTRTAHASPMKRLTYTSPHSLLPLLQVHAPYPPGPASL